MAQADNSLPVPVSPVRSTLASLLAACARSSQQATILGLLPTIASRLSALTGAVAALAFYCSRYPGFVGEIDMKAGPHAGLALHSDGSVVVEHYGINDRKTQPRAFLCWLG